MNVVFRYDAGPRLLSRLKAFEAQGLRVICVPESEDEAYFRALEEAEALWHVLAPVTADQIARAPKLRLIQKIGVGTNTIDLDAAKAAGIAVCNMPGTNTQAVAEATLLLILSALRLQPRMDRLVRSGVWSPDQATRESFGEVAGKTVGFVGFGHVPQRLAPVLAALGARIIYANRSAKDVAYRRVDLPDLLTRADIVSLHVPLTDQSQGMIGAEQLAQMKRGAVLINTARGALVDEQALIGALESGHLSAAGLDVFAVEPSPADNRLFALDNVAVMPHVAWLTEETLDRSMAVAVRNSLAVQAGATLNHRIV